MKSLYIVVVSEGYLRDTQCVVFPDDPAIKDPDMDDENDRDWSDFSAPGFIGCAVAETPEEACKVIAEEEYYDVRLLEAIKVPGNDWLQK